MTVSDNNTAPTKVKRYSKTSPCEGKKTKTQSNTFLNNENKKNIPCEEDDEIISGMMDKAINNEPLKKEKVIVEEQVEKDKYDGKRLETFVKHKLGNIIEECLEFNNDFDKYQFIDDYSKNFKSYENFEELKEIIIENVNESYNGYIEKKSKKELEKQRKNAENEVNKYTEKFNESCIFNVSKVGHVFTGDMEMAQYFLSKLNKDGFLFVENIEGKDVVRIHNPNYSNKIEYEKEAIIGILSQAFLGVEYIGSFGKPTKIKNISYIKSIYEALCSTAKSYKNKINNLQEYILDITEGKVFYKDGYYDLYKQKFITIDEDKKSFTNIRIEENFFDIDLWNSLSEEHKLVKDVRKEFLSCVGDDVESQNHFLKLIGRMIGGHYDDKEGRVNIAGSGRNGGKSATSKALECCFGDYVVSINLPTYNKDENCDDDLSKKALIPLEGPRIALTNEIKHGKKIDASIFKVIGSGGDKQRGRRLHVNSKEFIITAGIIMNFNISPPPEFKGEDDCFDFVQVIDYPYTYDAKPFICKCKDKSKCKCKAPLPTIRKPNENIKKHFKSVEFRIAFTWLVFKHWASNQVYKSNMPERSKTQYEVIFGVNTEKLTNSHSIYNKFLERFTSKDKNDDIDKYKIKSRQLTALWTYCNEGKMDFEKYLKIYSDNIDKCEYNSNKMMQLVNKFLKDQGIFERYKSTKGEDKDIMMWKGLKLLEPKDVYPDEWDEYINKPKIE